MEHKNHGFGGSTFAHNSSLHPFPSLDKDVIGNIIMRYSLIFVAITVCFPISLLYYNSVVEGQAHSIWWLKQPIPSLGWQRKPKPRAVAIDTWPKWAEIQRSLNDRFDDLVDLAFCSDQINSKGRHLFPLGEYSPWKNRFEPWLMDAVIAEGGTMVNILAIDALACEFDINAWQNLVRYSKTYGTSRDVHALANGSLEAINVKYPTNMGSLFTTDDFLGKRVICRYYDRKSALITSILSHKIIAGLIIRCPIPPIIRSRIHSINNQPLDQTIDKTIDKPMDKFTQYTSYEQLHMRLYIPYPTSTHRRLKEISNTNHNHLRVGMIKNVSTTTTSPSMSSKNIPIEKDHILTPLFTVCPQPQRPKLSGPFKQSFLTKQSDHPVSQSIDNTTTSTTTMVSSEVYGITESIESNPKYNLAVCVSTVSRSKLRLIEWIEYHRMIGVDHFFIYDRYIRSLQSSSASTSHSKPTSNPIQSPKSTISAASKDDDPDDDDGDDDDHSDDYSDGSNGNRNKDNSHIDSSSMNSTSSKNSSSISSTSHSTHSIDPMKSRDSLFEILRDYIDYGIVTIIPWPYKDCVDHMACDRSIRPQHIDKFQQGNSNSIDSSFVFHPPPKLQKQVATHSCYLRFQSSTKWMALLDDKDFIVFDSSQSNLDEKDEKDEKNEKDDKNKNDRKDRMIESNGTDSRSRKLLSAMISNLEKSHHQLAAIELLPSAVVGCPTVHSNSMRTMKAEDNEENVDCNQGSEVILDADADEESASHPPRYGIWQHMTSLPSSMKKLIVQTSMVSSLTQSHVLLVELPGDSAPSRPVHSKSFSSQSTIQSDRLNKLGKMIGKEMKGKEVVDGINSQSVVQKHIHLRPGRGRDGQDTVQDLYNNTTSRRAIRDLEIDKKRVGGKVRGGRRLTSDGYVNSISFTNNEPSDGFIPRLGKYEARRGSSTSTYEGEYSLAQLDPKIIRILEYRNVGENMNLCEKALFNYKSLHELCQDIESSSSHLGESIDSIDHIIINNDKNSSSNNNSNNDNNNNEKSFQRRKTTSKSYLTDRFVLHNLEELKRRYTHGLSGDILE